MKRNSRDGLSLVEVLIAMVILAMFAATVLAAILLGRRLAEANIYENTALTVTQGYLEQMKSMEYDVILESVDDNSIPLPTKSVSSLLTGENIEIDDFLYIGEINEKEVSIDIKDLDTGTPRAVTMAYEATITINDLDTGANPIKALEVTIDYRFLSPERGEPIWRDGSIRFVKSYAPTF